MPAPTFAPGFRLSRLDIAVLIIGMLVTAVLAIVVVWIAFVVGFTVFHFFLFCNVFRIARTLELIWAGSFVALCAATILIGKPVWLVTAAIALTMTILFVVLEMRKPSYHGVGWQFINPDLPKWWESQFTAPA